MPVPASRWLWKMLGGRVGTDGEPELDPNDPVVVFEGRPVPARRALDALRRAGIDAAGDAEAHGGIPGVSPLPAHCFVQVAAADAERARTVIKDAKVNKDVPPPDPPAVV